jgi:hypothetical protein
MIKPAVSFPDGAQGPVIDYRDLTSGEP